MQEESRRLSWFLIYSAALHRSWPPGLGVWMELMLIYKNNVTVITSGLSNFSTEVWFECSQMVIGLKHPAEMWEKQTTPWFPESCLRWSWSGSNGCCTLRAFIKPLQFFTLHADVLYQTLRLCSLLCKFTDGVHFAKQFRRAQILYWYVYWFAILRAHTLNENDSTGWRCDYYTSKWPANENRGVMIAKHALGVLKSAFSLLGERR